MITEEHGSSAPVGNSATGFQRPLLRRLPYPYRAMLAICSDLDETPDRHVYWETARYLNTTQTTAMGPGVGLEVGNTIYFDMPSDQFAYWNTDDAGREMVRSLIRTGHVDCLHSFGDLATTRGHAARALEELARHNCRLRTWIDHAVAPTNFGADIMRGSGDVVGSLPYHADLTIGFGIQYVWRGRVTSVVGQHTNRTLSGIFAPAHPIASGRTFLKEGVKGLLGYGGSSRYRPHTVNRVVFPSSLRDGRPVDEFLRANPDCRGVSSADTADGLADVIGERMFTRLTSRQGFCVLYTHLGKARNPNEPLPPSSRLALRQLASAQAEGRILVTTTTRLLSYVAMLDQLAFTHIQADGLQVLNVRLDRAAAGHPSRSASSDYVSGLTFYVDEPQRTRVFVNGCERAVQINPPDHTGRATISVPWHRLTFPSL